ncbi:hypothetical protein [Nonomuraea endophytica]|uniref:Uncharacterized protein n=1 Tax=Nonomuraea endophytica TaxID=714136 RepID=A0A7W8A9Q7_9ACTN|nr:hypothetical protein [Nonomuraea endophytica]MBB5080823.1 hypothetical protein [Nonomuraea endophytica]
MIKKMSLTVAALAVLTGCGSVEAGGEPEAGASATPGTATVDKKLQMESVLADCMKQKGFKYVAYVPPEEKLTAAEIKRDNGDYQELRKNREKYGFGVFAEFIYPGEVGISKKVAQADKDPNTKITGDLSTAQYTSYKKARDTCFALAAKEVLGKSITKRTDLFQQFSQAKKLIVAREVDGDQQLVGLASTMADCLRGKGYTVTETAPRDISMAVQDSIHDMASRIGAKQQGIEFDPGSGEIIMPELTAAQAKPYFQKEIKAALDDLECGKAFYPVYNPKDLKINNTLLAEYALR